jgi:hypothetical protein
MVDAQGIHQTAADQLEDKAVSPFEQLRLLHHAQSRQVVDVEEAAPPCSSNVRVGRIAKYAFVFIIFFPQEAASYPERANRNARPLGSLRHPSALDVATA